MSVDIVWNTAELERTLQSPDGDVGRYLARRAVKVESRAKLNATHRPGPYVRTGRLRSSIHWSFDTAGGLSAVISTNMKYADYVERGHRVVRNGKVVGVAPPYPYLRPALSAAA